MKAILSLALALFMLSSQANADHTPDFNDVKRVSYWLADDSEALSNYTWRSYRTVSYYAEEVHIAASDVYHFARQVSGNKDHDDDIDELRHKFDRVERAYRNLNWAVSQIHEEDHTVERMFDQVSRYYRQLEHAVYGGE